MIQINLSNKLAYTLIAVLLILTVSLLVYAAPWDTTKTVYHSASDVKVTIPNEGDMSLQDAINGSKLGGAGNCEKIGETGIAEIVAKKVAVPDYCKDGNVCFLIYVAYLGTYASYTRRTTIGNFYTQDYNGYYDYYLFTDPWVTSDDVKNGDSISNNFMYRASSSRVFDDLSARPSQGLNENEFSKDYWVLWDDANLWSTQLYACPAYSLNPS